MGTRGAFGVRVDGKDKITYNHFDSYLEGLGKDLAVQVGQMMRRKNALEQLREKARSVVLIKEEESLSDAVGDVRAKELAQKYGNAGVSTGVDTYAALRELQGDLKAILDDAKVMIDAHSFLADSLFCEFAYIVNLDDDSFEIYRGFQKTPHNDGRYATMPRVVLNGSNQYAPVALVHTLPLTSSLASAFNEWAKAFAKAEAEEE
jgi:hypothetical protein